MEPFKNHKLLVNVSEFDNTGSRYPINGIDLGKAVFFWRKEQEMYDTIPKGSYKVTVEGGNTYLDITDAHALADIERIQICYEFASISSEYEVDFNVDTTILKDRYNEAVKDIKAIYEYVKKNMMTADGQDLTVVLPNLEKDEVWVKTEDGWRGFNIGSLEENIKAQIELFKQMVTTAFSEFEKERDKAIQDVITTGNTEEGQIITQGNIQYNRINAESTRLDNTLDLMWKMYSITTGANRYLSGNNLESRDNSLLEREVYGGNLAQRGDKPRRVYYGGNLVDRAIETPISIDLGQYTGGNK